MWSTYGGRRGATVHRSHLVPVVPSNDRLPGSEGPDRHCCPAEDPLVVVFQEEGEVLRDDLQFLIERQGAVRAGVAGTPKESGCAERLVEHLHPGEDIAVWILLRAGGERERGDLHIGIRQVRECEDIR